MATNERESVEQLAKAIAGCDVGGYCYQQDVERVAERVRNFLRSHNIDPATMQPMDDGEKGNALPLSLEDAKARRVCRICGGPDKGCREAWTYNYGKEFAHTRCLPAKSFGNVHTPGVSELGPSMSMSDPPPPQPPPAEPVVGEREIESFYLSKIDDIRRIARQSGYAIGVHGSCRRDFDLIAAPWTKTAASSEHLVEAIRQELNGVIVNEPDAPEWDETKRNPVDRPHGRRVWAIQLGRGRYLDLSVMPIEHSKAEPVVGERDRELYQDLWECVDTHEGEWLRGHMLPIIARHNAAEREELAIANRRGEELCAVLIKKHAELTDLQAQLAEAKKRVGKLEDALRRMQPWAGKVIEAMGAMCMVAAETDAQPATPSEGGIGE